MPDPNQEGPRLRKHRTSPPLLGLFVHHRPKGLCLSGEGRGQGRVCGSELRISGAAQDGSIAAAVAPTPLLAPGGLIGRHFMTGTFGKGRGACRRTAKPIRTIDTMQTPSSACGRADERRMSREMVSNETLREVFIGGAPGVLPECGSTGLQGPLLWVGFAADPRRRPSRCAPLDSLLRHWL